VTCGLKVRYRHLAKGSYVFHVEALRPHGRVSTPTTRRFAIR